MNEGYPLSDEKTSRIFFFFKKKSEQRGRVLDPGPLEELLNN